MKSTYLHNILIQILLLPVFLFVFIAEAYADGFLNEQKKYPRVRTAIAEKEELIKENLLEHGLTVDNMHILITVFKEEKELIIYAAPKGSNTFTPVSVYPVCALSGGPGPKRKQGDYQIPEGFYHIDRFNPSSNFYLSLGINYPNSSDKKKSTAANLGGDIFIHGSCVTIGCLPMTDDLIKEIYLYAAYARDNDQRNIHVYIYPFRMTDENTKRYERAYQTDTKLISFWQNIREGYLLFEKEKKALQVKTTSTGDYQFL